MTARVVQEVMLQQDKGVMVWVMGPTLCQCHSTGWSREAQEQEQEQEG